MKSISESAISEKNELAAATTARGVIITILFTLGLVLAKQSLESFGPRLPGSSGVYWMALLLLNRHYGMGRGAGTAMGVGSGALTWLAFSPGVRFGAGMDVFATYAASGIVIDLLYAQHKNILLTAIRWAGAAAAANALKFVIHATFKSMTHTFSWALIFGKWNALGTHILFGAAGGLLAFAIVYLARKNRSRAK
jgi:hypothetical protein